MQPADRAITGGAGPEELQHLRQLADVTTAVHLENQPLRSPLRMSAAQLADRGLRLGRSCQGRWSTVAAID
jgi:hypothetical protein